MIWQAETGKREEKIECSLPLGCFDLKIVGGKDRVEGANWDKCGSINMCYPEDPVEVFNV